MPLAVFGRSAPEDHLGYVIDVQKLKGVDQRGFAPIVGSYQMDRFAQIQIRVDKAAAIDGYQFLNAVVGHGISSPSSGVSAVSTSNSVATAVASDCPCLAHSSEAY